MTVGVRCKFTKRADGSLQATGEPAQPPKGRVRALVPVLAILVGAGTATAGPAWVLGGGVALALVFATYSAPGFLLAAYLAIPFYKGTLQPLIPVDLTIVLAGLNAMQVFVLLAKRPFTHPVALALWIVLAGMILVGTSYAINGAVALSTAASWIALVFLPLLAAIRVASDPKAVRQFVLTLGCFSVTFIAGGVIGLLGSQAISRLLVLDTNTINVARAALLLPVLGVAYLTTNGHELKRWLVLALTPAAITVGVASGSRGPVLFALAVLGAALLSIALTKWRGALRRLLGIGMLGALGVAAVLILLPALPALSLLRFDSLFAFVAGSGGGPDTSTAARLTLFDVAWRMFLTQPLFGWGTAGFASFTAYDPSLAASIYPHNALLQFAAEFGLLGLVAVCSLLLVALRRRLPEDPAWHAIRYAFLFMALNSLVSGNIYDDRMLWGLTLLLAFHPHRQGSRAPDASARRSLELKLDPKHAQGSSVHAPMMDRSS